MSETETHRPQLQKYEVRIVTLVRVRAKTPQEAARRASKFQGSIQKYSVSSIEPVPGLGGVEMHAQVDFLPEELG